MPIATTITRRGTGLKKLTALLLNPAPALLAGGSGLADNIRLGFRTSTDPWGGEWKRLVVRKGKPLIDTGLMRSSIAARVSGKLAIQVYAGDSPAKTNLHQFGGFTTINGRRVYVPARPFFPVRGGRVDLPARWRSDMVADVVTAIKAAL